MKVFNALNNFTITLKSTYDFPPKYKSEYNNPKHFKHVSGIRVWDGGCLLFLGGENGPVLLSCH